MVHTTKIEGENKNELDKDEVGVGLDNGAVVTWMAVKHQITSQTVGKVSPVFSRGIAGLQILIWYDLIRSAYSRMVEQQPNNLLCRPS